MPVSCHGFGGSLCDIVTQDSGYVLRMEVPANCRGERRTGRGGHREDSAH